LFEVLAAVNRSTYTKLAILGVNKQAFKTLNVQSLKLKPPISLINRQFMQEILAVLPKTLLLSQMLDSGYRLAVRDNVCLLNLLPIDPHLESSVYLMFVHDISKVFWHINNIKRRHW
jgi:hypothetical protein